VKTKKIHEGGVKMQAITAKRVFIIEAERRRGYHEKI
jgi:hypothetical protein